jgi:hypothetical protein
VNAVIRRCEPVRPALMNGWHTQPMPYLDDNPTGGQKKLLQMFGVIGGIMVVIAIVATIAANMG